MKSDYLSHLSRLLGISLSIAAMCLLGAPLLSGSNHTCPVLRRQDLEKGPSAQAIPAFARKYNVDCTYCHTAWPQLNRTGYIFRRLGYRMPYEVPTSSGAAPSSPLPPGVTKGLKQAVPATATEPTPAEKIANGAIVFHQMQCFTCHANGENLIDPSKPIKGSDFRKKYPADAQLAELIRKGRPGTAMPAYDQQRMTDEQLSALIAYVRSLTPQ
jgi:mono/diheme cytochrome c family protein